MVPIPHSALPLPISDIIDGNESVLWHGKPSLNCRANSIEYLLILYRYVIGTAVVSMFAWALSGTSTVPLILVSILLCILHLLLHPVANRTRYRHTYFFVTDRRVAVVRDMFLGRKVQTIEFNSRFQMQPNDCGHGATTIVFNPTWIIRLAYLPMWSLKSARFSCVENAGLVLEVIISAQNSALVGGHAA